jgi:hypothetical protein
MAKFPGNYSSNQITPQNPQATEKKPQNLVQKTLAKAKHHVRASSQPVNVKNVTTAAKSSPWKKIEASFDRFWKWLTTRNADPKTVAKTGNDLAEKVDKYNAHKEVIAHLDESAKQLMKDQTDVSHVFQTIDAALHYAKGNGALIFADAHTALTKAQPANVVIPSAPPPAKPAPSSLTVSKPPEKLSVEDRPAAAMEELGPEIEQHPEQDLANTFVLATMKGTEKEIEVAAQRLDRYCLDREIRAGGQSTGRVKSAIKAILELDLNKRSLDETA